MRDCNRGSTPLYFFFLQQEFSLRIRNLEKKQQQYISRKGEKKYSVTLIFMMVTDLKTAYISVITLSTQSSCPSTVHLSNIDAILSVFNWNGKKLSVNLYFQAVLRLWDLNSFRTFGLKQYLRTFSAFKQLASLVAQTVKNLPAMWETLVWSLGQEDPLEKGMATHSSILAWKIPRTQAPGGLQSMGSQRVGKDWVINTFTY